MSGRLPDYRLAGLKRDTEEKNNIGAAWRNTDGSISIRLDAFVTISASRDLLLTLFPADSEPKRKQYVKKQRPIVDESPEADQPPF